MRYPQVCSRARHGWLHNCPVPTASGCRTDFADLQNKKESVIRKHYGQNNMVIFCPKMGWWKSRAYLNKYHNIAVLYTFQAVLSLAVTNCAFYNVVMIKGARSDPRTTYARRVKYE